LPEKQNNATVLVVHSPACAHTCAHTHTHSLFPPVPNYFTGSGS